MQNLKPLVSLFSWAGWFESYLIENPEDMFSRDEAQIIVSVSCAMFDTWHKCTC